MERAYYAHTPNSSGRWHGLSEHLNDVARLARDFSAKFAAGEVGYWAGLFHDFGKFNPEFQDYLKACHENPAKKNRSPGHSLVGAVYGDKIWCGFPFLIAGHHGGLPDCVDIKQKLSSVQDHKYIIDTAKKELGLVEPLSIKGSLPSFVASEVSAEFFLRMLFSALVDADFLDTESHFDSDRKNLRNRYPELSTLWERFEESQRLFSGRKGDPLNRARHEIYRHCLKAAESQQGVFRLTVPTGGGKTRSGMAFALRHALKHKLDRVIVAIPYTSIIEQTAAVYRDIFGSNAVVEHHSAIDPEIYRGECFEGAGEMARLATENWDAPIIVTTTVQLFESLFANSPSRCRKLHNIAKSVIVLDEVQTLPSGLLDPILDVLKELATNYRATIVLCTATQPALESSIYLKGFEEITEIIPEPPRYFKALKRVEYEMVEATWSWKRVAEEVGRTSQSLTIVNTKKDAVALLDVLDIPDVFYLSRDLCPAHRREILVEAKKRLDRGEPCRLVSTQVVEAGVDIDFPMVLRAVGPLDRIVQAAGRCNREGRLEAGRVVLFRPEDGSLPPGDYRSGTETARALLCSEGTDLHDPALYEEYFRRFYLVVETDKHGIQSLRQRLNFRTVAERFQMIGEATVPVVVRYNKKAESLIEAISSRGLNRELSRDLQPYMVSVYRNKVASLERDGLIEAISSGLYLWLGSYDRVRGISAYKAVDPDDLIF